MIKILILDETADQALKIINNFEEGEAQATLITHADKAKISVVNTRYDLIIMGDKMKGGDTYDVALSMRSSKQNKRTPVLCMGMGRNVQKATKLSNLLGSQRCMVVDTSSEEEITLAADLICDSLIDKLEDDNN